MARVLHHCVAMLSARLGSLLGSFLVVVGTFSGCQSNDGQSNDSSVAGKGGTGGTAGASAGSGGSGGWRCHVDCFGGSSTCLDGVVYERQSAIYFDCNEESPSCFVRVLERCEFGCAADRAACATSEAGAAGTSGGNSSAGAPGEAQGGAGGHDDAAGAAGESQGGAGGHHEG
jgi:hypothetical protein